MIVGASFGERGLQEYLVFLTAFGKNEPIGTTAAPL
jgi:hypothetical protein